MRTRTLLLAFLVTLAGATVARGQTPTAADAQPAPVLSVDKVGPPHAAIHSSIDQPSAVRRDTRPSALSVRSASTKGLGEARALMIVGAGAFVAGAIIGGDAGTIVMVGGAVIGLYGLYEYLK